MSSISKAAGFSSENIESPEESGWTTYLEDFFNNPKSSSSISSGVNSSSSLVSDATSLNLAAKKVTYIHDQTRDEEYFTANQNVISHRSSNFKKRKKTTEVNMIGDNVFADSASSPLVNSFKKKGSHSDRKELDLKGRHTT